MKQKLYSICEKTIFRPIHSYQNKIKNLYLIFKLKLRHLKNRFKYGQSVSNPFGIIFVDPKDIQKFSGRKSPPHKDKFKDLGTIKNGYWDKNKPEDNRDKYISWHNKFWYKFHYGTYCFSNTASFKHKTNFYQNIDKGCELEETDYYALCKNKRMIDANEYLENLTKLFQSIKQNGFKPSSELHNSFKNKLDDVMIDIGRNGELLFVDGRHRLTIAKYLELDSIPVRVVCRHKKWVETKKETMKNNTLEYQNPPGYFKS